MTRFFLIVSCVVFALAVFYRAGGADERLQNLEIENQILEGASDAELSTDDADRNFERLLERARQ